MEVTGVIEFSAVTELTAELSDGEGRGDAADTATVAVAGAVAGAVDDVVAVIDSAAIVFESVLAAVAVVAGFVDVESLFWMKAFFGGR